MSAAHPAGEGLAALGREARTVLDRGDALGALAFLDGARAEFGPAAENLEGFAATRAEARQKLGREPEAGPEGFCLLPGAERICSLCRIPMQPFERAFAKDWLRCPECGLLQYATEPDEAARLDQGEPSGAKLPPDSLVHRRELFFCDLFIDGLGLTDVLLYGVGWSLVPETLRGRGINAVGCDLWRPLIAERRAALGPESFYHRDELPEDARFDLVSAFEVFEHFLDPAQDAGRLARLLRDKGAIVGCTDFWHGDRLSRHPNPDATYWRHRTHVTAWSWRSMRRLAGTLGLTADFFKVDTPGFAAKVFFMLHRGPRFAAFVATQPKVFRRPF